MVILIISMNVYLDLELDPLWNFLIVLLCLIKKFEIEKKINENEKDYYPLLNKKSEYNFS